MSLNKRAVLIPIFVFFILAPTSNGSASDQDTILERDFCQKYWAGDQEKCAAVKAKIVANHSRPLPTLELGDPAQPAMFFLHGWPDNGAEWANLFGAFGEDYFCVATTMTNFHPDLPMVTDRSQLAFGSEVDKMAAVAKELGLKNITLVAHDWGSAFGYIFAFKYPELISRVVQFDIGGKQPMPTPTWVYDYQHVIIKSWDTKSDVMLKPFASGVPNPAALKWQIGWPYVAVWNDGNDTTTWKHEAFPEVDPKSWTWYSTPGPIPQPLLVS
jgi:pimeloyl-ACP methyl ester carboxylesterase